MQLCKILLFLFISSLVNSQTQFSFIPTPFGDIDAIGIHDAIQLQNGTIVGAGIMTKHIASQIFHISVLNSLGNPIKSYEINNAHYHKFGSLIPLRNGGFLLLGCGNSAINGQFDSQMIFGNSQGSVNKVRSFNLPGHDCLLSGVELDSGFIVIGYQQVQSDYTRKGLLMKINLEGDTVLDSQQITIPGSKHCDLERVKQAQDGNLIIQGASGLSYENAFIMKVNKDSLDFIWSQVFSGYPALYLYDFDITSNGDIVVVGEHAYASTVGTLSSSDGTPSWLTMYIEDGVQLHYDSFNSVQVASDGTIYAGGIFNQQFLQIAILDQNGALQSTQLPTQNQFGGFDYTGKSNSIFLMNDGGRLVSGNVQLNHHTGFIARMGQEITLDSQLPTQIVAKVMTQVSILTNSLVITPLSLNLNPINNITALQLPTQIYSLDYVTLTKAKIAAINLQPLRDSSDSNQPMSNNSNNYYTQFIIVLVFLFLFIIVALILGVCLCLKCRKSAPKSRITPLAKTKPLNASDASLQKIMPSSRNKGFRTRM